MIIFRIISIYCILNLATFLVLWFMGDKDANHEFVKGIPFGIIGQLITILILAFCVLPVGLHTVIIAKKKGGHNE